MNELVTILLIFLAVGAGFLAVNMMVGKLVRPHRPSAEKQSIYECGEPAIGSSWIQFDLRFYVVALLFVIFDVEMAFFFPWATVFGNANKLAQSDLSIEQRSEAQNGILPGRLAPTEDQVNDQRSAAKRLAWFAFADILFFFGVLLVGFAYLWKRGDLDWVRSTAAQLDLPPPASET
jgi:NADH-quinone oxidoreductase subunit A